MKDINIIFKTAFLISILLLIGCNQDFSSPNNNWVRDKKGCYNLRTKKLADSLTSKYNLYLKGEKEFIKVFGQADYKINGEKYKEICYYFNSNCNNDEIIKESDKCVFIFEFKNDSLLGFHQQCE